eukprot:2349686-Pleurochrysis_carterae.AAC.2
MVFDPPSSATSPETALSSRACSLASARFHSTSWPDATPPTITSGSVGQKRKQNTSPGASSTNCGWIGSEKFQRRTYPVCTFPATWTRSSKPSRCEHDTPTTRPLACGCGCQSLNETIRSEQYCKWLNDCSSRKSESDLLPSPVSSSASVAKSSWNTSIVSFCWSASSYRSRTTPRNSRSSRERITVLASLAPITRGSYWIALFAGLNQVVCVLASAQRGTACTATSRSTALSSKLGSL